MKAPPNISPQKKISSSQSVRNMETSNFPTLSRYLFGGPLFRVMLLLGLIISTFESSEAMPAGTMDSAYRH